MRWGGGWCLMVWDLAGLHEVLEGIKDATVHDLLERRGLDAVGGERLEAASRQHLSSASETALAATASSSPSCGKRVWSRGGGGGQRGV